jgi:hypothetical protein
MANEVLVKQGTTFSFADHVGDFIGGATKTSIEPAGSTDVQLAVVGVAAGAARESAKVNLGAVRAARYSVNMSCEWATAPVTGETVDLYWAPSPNATAANGNPQSIDGVDADAPSGHSTLTELLAVCQSIGSFVASADATATVQTGYVGIFSPAERYGMLIWVNSTSDDVHSDDVECVVIMTEIVDEVQ